jgi:hypothetical protein
VVRRNLKSRFAAVSLDEIEAIHLSMVVLFHKAKVRVREVLERQEALFEIYFMAQVIVSVGCAVRTGIGCEKIIEAAVLLDQDDDVVKAVD